MEEGSCGRCPRNNRVRLLCAATGSAGQKRMETRFEEAFNSYILNQKAVRWGFQQPEPVKLANGYHAYPCGYFTEFENGYRLIVSGATLGQTPIQEAMILDPRGMPIARDTEDIRNS